MTGSTKRQEQSASQSIGRWSWWHNAVFRCVHRKRQHRRGKARKGASSEQSDSKFDAHSASHPGRGVAVSLGLGPADGQRHYLSSPERASPPPCTLWL